MSIKQLLREIVMTPEEKRCLKSEKEKQRLKTRDYVRDRMFSLRKKILDARCDETECYDVFEFEPRLISRVSFPISMYGDEMKSIKIDYMNHEIHIRPYER